MVALKKLFKVFYFSYITGTRLHDHFWTELKHDTSLFVRLMLHLVITCYNTCYNTFLPIFSLFPYSWNQYVEKLQFVVMWPRNFKLLCPLIGVEKHLKHINQNQKPPSGQSDLRIHKSCSMNVWYVMIKWTVTKWGEHGQVYSSLGGHAHIS